MIASRNAPSSVERSNLDQGNNAREGKPNVCGRGKIQLETANNDFG